MRRMLRALSIVHTTESETAARPTGQERTLPAAATVPFTARSAVRASPMAPTTPTYASRAGVNGSSSSVHAVIGTNTNAMVMPRPIPSTATSGWFPPASRPRETATPNVYSAKPKHANEMVSGVVSLRSSAAWNACTMAPASASALSTRYVVPSQVMPAPRAHLTPQCGAPQCGHFPEPGGMRPPQCRHFVGSGSGANTGWMRMGPSSGICQT